MTVRIHEADGTPYEHVLDIREGFKTYDVPFNTKYKRVRRNTKRYLARKAAAAAAAAGDVDAAEAMGMLDLGFDLAIWEEEEERDKWRVADWTEEEENEMVGAPYEWIRLDADFEWIANVRFVQPDYYWVSQLQRDRDVVAQVEVSLFFFPPFSKTRRSLTFLGLSRSSGDSSASTQPLPSRHLYPLQNRSRHELLLPSSNRSCQLSRSREPLSFPLARVSTRLTSSPSSLSPGLEQERSSRPVPTSQDLPNSILLPSGGRDDGSLPVQLHPEAERLLRFRRVLCPEGELAAFISLFPIPR